MQDAPQWMESTPLGARRLILLITVALAVTLIVMDGSIVNVALPTLVDELGGTTNSELQWIVDSYILVFSTLLLAAGTAADRWGRRRLLVMGGLIFAVTSVGAARSTTAGELVAWRAAMGVGAAMIFPSTLAILTHAFPEPRWRRMAIGVWAACSGLGVAAGPIAGGWILVHGHWGWIFLVNVPIVVLVWLGAMTSIKESRDPHRGAIDLVGNSLAVIGLLAFVWSLIEGPVRGWTSIDVLVPLVFSGVIGSVFIVHQQRAAQPMLDLALVRSRACATGLLAIGAAFFGLFGFVFMVTQFLQFVRGHDPLEAGIRTLPFAGAILVGAVACAVIGSRVRRQYPCAVGLALMAAGFAWSSQDAITTTYFTLAGQMAVLGVGLGLVSASATEVIIGAVRSERFGLASSLNDTARELGGAIGVAAMGSVFNAVYRQRVLDAVSGSPLPPDAQVALADSLGVAVRVIARIEDMAGSEAATLVRRPVLEAFMAGFHDSALVAAGLAAAGAFATLVLMRESAQAPVASHDEPSTEHNHASRP
jgi:EmrB/QacA subfamily drug resistance transporter